MGLKQKTLAIVGGFLVIFEAVFEAIFWGALVFVAVNKRFYHWGRLVGEYLKIGHRRIQN